MIFKFMHPRSRRDASRGFTLLEIMLVVVIIGLLVVVAVPLYQSYVARSQATELALKFDAVRTNIQVAAKSGDVQTACANLASTVQSGNLQSTYAQLAVNFEPVTGGFTPVLTMCATLANQGQKGVEVTREAHHLLSRDSVIGQGAVIGDSAVSFSVKLAGDTALCKVLPPNTGNGVACTPSNAPTGGGFVRPPDIAPLPVQAVSKPIPAASTPVTSTPTPGIVVVQPSLPANSQPVTTTTAMTTSPTTSTSTITTVLPPLQPQAPTLGQCTAQCRVLHPHGNSIAFRNCVAQCR